MCGEVDEDEATSADEASYLSIPALLKLKRQHEEQMSLVSTRVVEQVDPASGGVLRRYRDLAAAVGALRVPARGILKCLQGAEDRALGFVWRVYEGSDAATLDRTCTHLPYHECMIAYGLMGCTGVVEQDNLSAGRVPLGELILLVRENKRLGKAGKEERDAAGQSEDDEDLGDIEEVDEGEAAEPGPARGSRTGVVEQLDMVSGAVLKRFPNQATAAAAVNGLETFISKCLQGVVDEAYGFKWRYERGDGTSIE